MDDLFLNLISIVYDLRTGGEIITFPVFVLVILIWTTRGRSAPLPHELIWGIGLKAFTLFFQVSLIILITVVFDWL